MLGSQLLPLLVGEDESSNLSFGVVQASFSDLAIVSSVNYYFSQNFSLAVNAAYCNETPVIDDTKNLVELLVVSFDVPRFRKQNLKRVRVEVLAHVWYRAQESLCGAEDLVDEVVDLFDQKVLEVWDYEATVGEVKVGCLKLSEAVATDLSDRQRDNQSVNYQHWLVRVPGVAQEIEF